ncbi:hypothetical protein [Micromonospora fluostatini]|uniref:hypothetical protein n=1 Tax=Micromonospora sp. JCM 30529 TaxID=3421643 RepID=UPI003D16F02A
MDYESLIDALVQQAEALSELPMLRVHWHDSARDGVPDGSQQFIGDLPNVKLRLGRFGVERPAERCRPAHWARPGDARTQRSCGRLRPRSGRR